MARTFTKSTSNYMSLGNSGIGSVINGATAVSVHARIRINSFSAGQNDNNIFGVIVNGTSGGLTLSIDGTNGKLRCSARSVSTDTAQRFTATTALTTGVDYSVGVVVDYTGKTITLYVNGVSDGTASTLAFGNNAFTLGTPTDNDVVGGFQAPPPSTSVQFDGVIGHVAVWTSALTGANFVSLANGVPASAVGSVAWFLPIGGAASPEAPTVGTASGTITGSLPAVLALGTTSASAYPASHPITFSHTILGGGANKVLVVGLVTAGAAPAAISSVTYGGVAMTQGVLLTGTGRQAALYYLVNPTAGAANVVITLASASGQFGGFGISFTGADQTTPINVTNTASAPNTLTLSESITTGVANVYLVDAAGQSFSGTAGTNTPGSGQIGLLNTVDAASFTAGVGSWKGVGATGAQAMSWVATHGDATWESVVASVQPVVVGGGGGGGARSSLLLVGVG